MKTELKQNLQSWAQLSRTNLDININTSLNDFNYCVNRALTNSLKIKRKRTEKRTLNISWDSRIYNLTWKENFAFQKYLHGPLMRKIY
jgi:hypothetical protein